MVTAILAAPQQLSIRYRMEKAAAKGQRQATRQIRDRDAWITGAIAILAEHGVDGLRVETLAKRLGVTKGSFYWHFKDRRDLFDAVLTHWKDGRIKDIRKQTHCAPGGEAQALLDTIEVYAAVRNRKGLLIEAAVRDWARRDTHAATMVADVDAERLACACRLCLACGMDDTEARARSVMFYAYIFGISLMRCERFAPDLVDLKRRIARHIADGTRTS